MLSFLRNIAAMRENQRLANVFEFFLHGRLTQHGSLYFPNQLMIVPFDRIDKSCQPIRAFALREHLIGQVAFVTIPTYRS
jgi:hypothetical protein